MSPGLVTVMAGSALVIPGFVGCFSAGVPTHYCPLPLLTIVPAFLLSSVHLQSLAAFTPTVFFFAWSAFLFCGRDMVPRRSYVLLIVLTILSTVDFAGGWHYGLKYQGANYTFWVCAANTAWLLVLGFLFARSWRRPPSFMNNVVVHWLLFAWLGWYAFPWLGELP